MYKFLIVLIFIIPFASNANIWTKADGPFGYAMSYNIFNYDNNLYSSSQSNGLSVYKLDNKEWTRLDTGFFSGKGLIHYFDQKENVVLTSTDSGIYLSYNYGKDWKHFDTLGGFDRFHFVTIVDETIFLQSNQFRSLYKLEKGSETLEKIYANEQKTDSIFADVIITNDNYIFAADPVKHYDVQDKEGTLYISSDKGESWKLSETMNKKIKNLLFHEDILLAFTEEDGLFRSTDYGKSWTTDTNLVIKSNKVASYKNLIFSCENEIQISTDNGISWKVQNNGLKSIACRDIRIVNDTLYYFTNQRIIYYFDYENKLWIRNTPITDDVSQEFISAENDTLFTTGSYTINYSIDNGLTWSIYSDSLYYNFTNIGRIYKQDSVIFALNRLNSLLLISIDYGQSWRFETLGKSENQPWIGDVLLMDNRILLFTKFGNFYSEDVGLNWVEYEGEVLDKDVKVRRYYRLSNSKIIVYSEVGLYLTYNNGLTWVYEKADEEVMTHYYTYREDNNLYTMDFLEFDQIYKSTNLGRTWVDLEINIESGLRWASIIPYNGNLILLTSTGVFVSDNEGKEWTKYEINLFTPDQKELYFYSGLIVDECLVLTSAYGNWRAKLSDLGVEVKSSVESEIERNYLYTYPPYPNPAKSEVKVLFYWDINLPMTTDDISIYDITGKKIDAIDKISLVKQESHYGNLIWDCSTAQPGIYLINIKHGTEEKTVKVVVE
ncbi:MAG: T9SS type A sorting domain-containing protein [Candidatus Kapaibacterium sp.]